MMMKKILNSILPNEGVDILKEVPKITSEGTRVLDVSDEKLISLMQDVKEMEKFYYIVKEFYGLSASKLINNREYDSLYKLE
jgi:hypothetical protein